MPFDASTPADTQAHTPVAQLRGREALAYLATALEAPMPKGFAWDYTVIHERRDCGTVGCAIGLANRIWPLANLVPTCDFRWGLARSLDNVCAFFGITRETAGAIFADPSTYGDGELQWEEIEPQMVAQALRTYLGSLR